MNERTQTGWILFFKNIAYSMDAILRFILVIPMKREDGRYNATLLRERGEKELAVCITGCDTGFGRELAVTLAERGFVVFAGCLTEQGQRQFHSKKNILAMKFDVTREEEVTLAANTVNKWLSDPRTRIPRYLHALINNAGIGVMGYIDWLNLSEYRKTMEGKRKFENCSVLVWNFSCEVCVDVKTHTHLPSTLLSIHTVT